MLNRFKKSLFLLLFLLNNIIIIKNPVEIYSQESIKSLSAPINHNPKFKKAKEYFYNGKFAMARVFLEDLTFAYPEEAEIYTYLADSLYHLRKYKEALLNYRKANELLPAISEGRRIKAQNYYQMGKILYILKEAEDAMAHFELSAMTDSHMSHGYYKKGITALFLLRNKELTVKAWKDYYLLLSDEMEKKKIKSAIDILSNPKFKLPPEGSPLSLKEALRIAGLDLEAPGSK